MKIIDGIKVFDFDEEQSQSVSSNCEPGEYYICDHGLKSYVTKGIERYEVSRKGQSYWICFCHNLQDAIEIVKALSMQQN